jgi:hypothetical protein
MLLPLEGLLHLSRETTIGLSNGGRYFAKV